MSRCAASDSRSRPTPGRVVSTTAASRSAVSEDFGVDGHRVWNQLTIGDVCGPKRYIECSPRGGAKDVLRKAWDGAWLRGALPVSESSGTPEQAVRVVDLFSGCGAMSLGVKLAAEQLGLRFDPVLAADVDLTALAVYQMNLRPRTTLCGDLATLISFAVQDGLTPTATACDEIASLAGNVDLVIGGPPCQGHSDLNNHSRRHDPKNSLYLVMPAAVAILKPRAVIIENVPAVIHDRSGVVATTESWLKSLGYHVVQARVALSDVGIAQRRRRHVLLATREAVVDVDAVLKTFHAGPRPARWAIGDLADLDSDSIFDQPSIQTEANRKRIDWLFENGKFDLPNRRRPPCHRDKEHSYVSMYGRMKWNEPAQTVTSGYGSPGQGRYVHPSRRRTLTPHEAARLQFFPDSFRFFGKDVRPKRTQLATMIGNAVPPKLSYVFAIATIAASIRFQLGAGRENRSRGRAAIGLVRAAAT